MKIALIVGNGQSTKLLYDYGFHNIPSHIDVYCTSLAFRFCDDLNYQPTYYVFSDPKSVSFQKSNLKQRIHAYQKTQKWFLCCNKVKKEYFESDKVTNIKHTGSGPGALEIALNKKYDKILIIGLDHNYTWMKKNVKFLNIENCAEYKWDVVDHPSYFYPTYIRKGDVVSWDMSAKDNETKIKKCGATQNLINSGLKKKIIIVDYSDNLLSCPKSKNLEEHFNI